MRKCSAEFSYGGKWIRIVSRYRPFLAAAMTRFYDDEGMFKQIRATCHNQKVDTVIDAGAAIGYYSIMYTFSFPRAKIYSLEPSTTNYRDLIENVGPFLNIIPMKLAALDRNGAIDLALPKPETKALRHSPENPGQISVHGDSLLYNETVPCKKLDDIFETADFIKIDTEGADLMVLKGGYRLLRDCRPTVQVEMMTANFEMGGYSVPELLDFMAALNYKPIGAWGMDFIFRPMEYLTEEERKQKMRVAIGTHACRLEKDENSSN